MQYRSLGRTGVQVSTLVHGSPALPARRRGHRAGRRRADAIDGIVAPGVDLAAHEKLDTPPALLDASLRRR